MTYKENKQILLAFFITMIMMATTLFTQAQISWCDSISYSTLPQQTFTVIGDASSLSNITDSVTWDWTACNPQYCHNLSGQTTIFSFINPTDTWVKICYNSYIYLNGGLIYGCTSCDSLVWDWNSNMWVSTIHNNNNPTSINELTSNKVNDGRMYDMLGRELNKIPVGTIYIRNNKLYITNE